mgnify:CR=1 FL=1
MIRFLVKGLLRDRSRSLFPIIVVSIGVTLTVLLQAWLQGAMGDVIRSTASFSTGHVKIMTGAHAESSSRAPNDLALMGTADLKKALDGRFPEMNWVSRIHFGGLLDVPDNAGETRSQGPAIGLAVDLLSPGSTEPETLNVKKALVKGRIPGRAGEILVSDQFAEKLGIGPGDKVTLMSSTMYGSMSMYNFQVSGTVRFGINAMDRGAVLIDISDIRQALDMNDATGELLGFFRNGIYDDAAAKQVKAAFNEHFNNPEDDFSPTMITLSEQNGLRDYIEHGNYFSSIGSAVFVFAMSIVLWNIGLIGGLRRYGEVGLRLAIGENKHHVYASLIVESLIIGGIGSIIGTAIGLILALYLQVHGIDIGAMTKNSSMMMSNVMRAEISRITFIIGFIPGFLSTLLGSALAGIGIYQRQTAQLFKELDT